MKAHKDLMLECFKQGNTKKKKITHQFSHHVSRALFKEQRLFRVREMLSNFLLHASLETKEGSNNQNEHRGDKLCFITEKKWGRKGSRKSRISLLEVT